LKRFSNRPVTAVIGKIPLRSAGSDGVVASIAENFILRTVEVCAKLLGIATARSTVDAPSFAAWP